MSIAKGPLFFTACLVPALSMCAPSGSGAGLEAGQRPESDAGPGADVLATSDSAQTNDVSCTGSVHFADPALDQAVRTAIGVPSGEIQPSQLSGLTALKIDQSSISDLSGIECLTAVTELRLTYTQIKDITPLARLTQLKQLDLLHSPIADISPLAPLTNITQLSVGLGGLALKGTDVVSSMPHLSTLYMFSAGLSDLTAIGKCKQLFSLTLDVNNVSDLGPLAGLTGLDYLSLYHNQVSDLSPLSQLTMLTSLNVQYNQVSDLTPLLPLTRLENLVLDDNPIDCVEQASNLAALRARLGGFMSTACQ